jgi:hypothetical protein
VTLVQRDRPVWPQQGVQRNVECPWHRRRRQEVQSIGACLTRTCLLEALEVRLHGVRTDRFGGLWLGSRAGKHLGQEPSRWEVLP